MKKLTTTTIALLAITITMSSCATVFGGKVTQAQRTKPQNGEPSRAIRPVAMIADILLFWPGLIVDFATGAIYRPNGNGFKQADAPKAEIKIEVEKSK